MLSLLSLILTYYRSFSYLRIIDSFTTLVGMINTILIKLLNFFLVLLYFYLFTGLLMKNLVPDYSMAHIFQKTYIMTLFGGVSVDDFHINPLVTVSIVFGTLMVTIVLMNILIAHLSNIFSRLEERQQINDLKEKAGMTLDLEVIFYFFNGGFLARKRDPKSDPKKRESGSDTIEYNFESSGDKDGEKFLYIFKPIDFQEIIEENQIDDNIYKKLKMIYKNIGQINQGLISRDAVINKNIAQFISILKSHSNVIKKTLEDHK